MSEQDYNSIELLLNIISTLFIIVGVIVVVPQIRMSAKSRFFEVASKVFDEVHNSDFLDLRDFIFDNASRINNLNREEQKMVERYIETFEKFCYYIDKKLLHERIFLEMYSRLVIKSWEILEDFVYWKRSNLRAINYAEHFEKVYLSSKKYRRKKFHNQ